MWQADSAMGMDARRKRLFVDIRAVPAQATAAAVILIGSTAFCGWMFRIPVLSSVLPGSVEMKANTSLCLIACAISQLILASHASLLLRRLAQALALAACMVGTATLIEYCFGWNLHLDELLFHDDDHAFSFFNGRMSPFSAISIAIIGAALAARPIRALRRASQLAGVPVIMVG